MQLVLAVITTLLVAGCSDDVEKPNDGSVGEAELDGTGDGWSNPCTQGLCTSPGGGDMYIPSEAGMPDLTMNCQPYPSACGPDIKCLIDKLCGAGITGQVDLKTCSFSCYWP